MDFCEYFPESFNEFEKQLNYVAYRNAIPLKGTFELTPTCNFNCVMCYIHLKPNEYEKVKHNALSNEEIIQIAKQAKEQGMLYLNLTGGEIFTRPGFKELYEQLHQMGFYLQLFSNGYLIDEKVIEWLSKIPPMMMRFTLYGASNETYEKVCGVSDGFDRVSKAVDLTLNAGIPLYLVSSIIKENIEDLFEMEEFAHGKGLLFKNTVTMISAVRGASADVKKHALTYIDIGKDRKNIPLYHHKQFYLNDCSNFRRGFVLTWDGKMSLCSFMESPNINIREQTFEESWVKLLTELYKIDRPEKCNGCNYLSYCNNCPGRLSAECGGLTSIPDEFCEEAKFYYNSKEKTGER